MVSSLQVATGIALLLGLAIVALCHKEVNLRSNCVQAWPETACLTGNITGLCSACLWFSCLLPQVILNCGRRSVQGLSPLWAAANFTAAYLQLNFIIRTQLPLYGKISGFYMPVIEALIVMQFVFYSMEQNVRYWMAVLMVVVAATTLCAAIFWDDFAAITDPAQWVAVVLWSVETLPQLWLNHRRQSTSGQAAETIAITLVGKTTDFASMFLLDLPMQSRVLAYFSTCTAYLNVCQYFWFRGYKGAARGLGLVVVLFSVLIGFKAGWTALACPVALALVLALGIKFQGTDAKKGDSILEPL